MHIIFDITFCLLLCRHNLFHCIEVYSEKKYFNTWIIGLHFIFTMIYSLLFVFCYQTVWENQEQPLFGVIQNHSKGHG